MTVGQKNYLILKEIIENRDLITSRELEDKFHLSRKQLGYRLEKINQYLEEQELPLLTRNSNGRIEVSEQLLSGLELAEVELENQDIYFPKEERTDVIYIILMREEKDLSLQHFMNELKVSRNTVLADLKKLTNELLRYDIQLEYSRENGYTLIGEEYSKRVFLYQVLGRLLSHHNYGVVLKGVCDISTKEMDEMQQSLRGIERRLKIQFTDRILELCTFFFLMILRRIHAGDVLADIPKSYQHVMGTKEYSVLKEFAGQHGITNIYETMYFTANIQGAKINIRLSEEITEYEDVGAAVDRVIDNFEQITRISFRYRDELRDMLINHCEPMVYRIRYNFHVEPDLTEYVLTTYGEIHNVVQNSVEPLEMLVGEKLTEREMVYITVIFGTQMDKEGFLKSEDIRPKAVVVCRHGVTVSHYLWMRLKQTFPEIQFITCLSVRQFMEYTEDFDLVFTTTALKTDKKQFIIEIMLGEKECLNLRKKVFDSNSVRLGAYPSKPDTKGKKGKRHLRSLLTKEHIRIAHDVMGWQEAVEFAAAPLLYEHIIEYDYVKAIVTDIIEKQPFLLVADGVIIAHSGIECGVNEVGFSVLVLPENISVFNYMEAQIIVVLSTPDYESHLTALSELIELLEKEDALEEMKQAQSPDDILKLL